MKQKTDRKDFISYFLSPEQQNVEGEIATIQLAAHASDFVLAYSYSDLNRLLLTSTLVLQVVKRRQQRWQLQPTICAMRKKYWRNYRKRYALPFKHTMRSIAPQPPIFAISTPYVSKHCDYFHPCRWGCHGLCPPVATWSMAISFPKA